MATNYSRGRSKEYRVCNKLKEQGFIIVQRSAGSHSPIDLFAIHKEDKKILFVQAKPKSLSENKRKKLFEELEWLNDKYLVEFKVI